MARRIVGTVWGLLLLALAFWLATRIPRTVTVFLTAAVIALGVHPITEFLERWMRRPIAIAVVYLVLFGGTVFLALLVIPTAISQTELVITSLPTQFSAFDKYLGDFQTTLQNQIGHNLLPPGATNLRAVVTERLTELATAAFASIGPMIVGTVTWLFILISAIVLSIFFLASGEKIRRQILSIVPHAREHEVAQVLDEIVNIFGGFVAGQSILCAITGISIWLLCWALGYKFALLVGVFCAIAYAVPFVGMLVAQIVAAILAAPQGWAMVWEVTIVVFVVSRIADNILVPKIMAPHVGVSPIAVMFGVFAGGELFGMPGLILGIPAAAMAKVLWRIFVRPWLSRHDFGPRPSDLGPGEREIDIEIHETIVERQPARPSTT
jgi:predicted PurR-regulated permease PerM